MRAIRTCGPDAERGRGIAALAALILVAALAVAWAVAVLPQPAQAQTSSTLVSNTGQTDGAKQFLTVDLALPFTTGTNTGGYRLTSVDIEGGFDTSTGTVDPTFTVGIHSGSGTSVGASVGSLTSSGFTSGTNSFTSSSGIDLDANTSYFVVFDLTASGDKDPWIRTTASNGEDSGASAGWTIGNRITTRDLTSTSWSLSSTTNVVEMSIKGLPRLSLTVSPSSLTESAVSTKVTVTATVGTAPAANLTVTLSEDGASTATSGTDYTALGTLASITIASGSTSGTAEVDIDPTEDTIDEGTGETIVLAGSATGFAPATATVTITDNDTASPISLSTSPSSIDEDGSATPVTVTATLPAGVTRSTDTVVTLNSTLAGTATGGGTDYRHSGLPASVTITAGSASGSATGLSIDPTDNDEAATDKTIIVNGSLTGYTVNSATITLAADEDPEITLRSERVGDGDDGSVDEGDSATFRITATRNTTDKSATVSVRLALVTTGDDASTAVSGTDFTALSSTTITIPRGAASGARNLTVRTTEDRLDEGTGETIVLGATVAEFTVNPVTITITDDDEPSDDFMLTVNDDSIGEGDTTKTTVTVTAEVDDAAPTANVTVALSLAGSAVAGTDYTDPGALTSITIIAGQVSGTSTFDIDPTDDSIDEDDETITVEGSATGGLTATASVDITLTDNDTAALTLDTGTTTSVGEGDSPTPVTVNATLDIERSKSTTVALSLSGSAEQGTDYTVPATLPSITIAAGSKTGTASLTITPTEDRLNEGTGEKITISGSATDVTGGSVDLTLADNDSPSTTVTVTAKTASDTTNVGEGDSATSFTVRATLNDAAFSTETELALTLAGTATAADYSFTPDAPKVTFDVGEPSATTTISINPTQDKIDEGASETIVVGVATSLTVITADITLTDDDTASSVTLSLDDSIVLRESDGDNLTSLPVEGMSTTVTVTATIDDGITRVVPTVVTLSLSGTATNHADDSVAADYKTSPNPAGSITITGGESEAEVDITFTPVQDQRTEGDETVIVGGAAPDLTVNSAQLTLSDDDSPSTSLTLGAHVSPALTETSGASRVRLHATLDGGTLDAAVVVSLVLKGPAQGGGVDYTVTENPLPQITIPAGELEAVETIHIDPVDDNVQEGVARPGVRERDRAHELITIGGSATVSGSTDTLDVNDGTVTIRDNDIASTRIGLSVDDSSVDEDATGVASVTVTATLDGSVTRSDPTVVALTFGGSAIQGTDYTAAPASPTVTIPAEASTGTATLMITPVNDEDDEGPETIIVRGTLDEFSVRETTINLIDDDLVVIGAVEDLAVSLQGRNAARLSWTPPEPGPVTGYRLQRRTADGDWANVATPQTSATAYTNGGLRYSTEYVWRLYASNEDGEGPASNEVTLTTGSRPPPSGGGGSPGGGGGGGSPAESPAGLSVPEPLSRPPRFTDVDPGSVLARGIERAATLGIMPGTSTDRFEPERLVTRLDTAAPMVRLWQALGGTCPRVTRSPFRDLPARGSARVDIACLHALGITNGTGANTYSPERILNRAQMMTLMARIWRLRGHDCPDDTPNPFADISDGHFHRNDILCMYAVGVTNGTSADTFSPDWQLTRAEVAVFAARFHDAARPS
ncbi:MAG: hypothetical protein F4071_13600 [Acidimicrobiaceae bacterium]|nr:hypothetical protein [Acidimicrobiaceae bacterium]